MPLVFAFFRRVLPLFAPSLLLGLLGGVLLLLRPLPYKRQADIVIIVALGVALAIALVAGARVLERLLPSYRFAQQQMERALRPLRLTRLQALLLAAVTSVAEELFFRGALLPLIGVWGQALVFGLLHPATRRGWSYSAYTAVAGLIFGYTTLLTGSLWAAVVAHFLINTQGFFELRRRSKRLSQPRNS